MEETNDRQITSERNSAQGKGITARTSIPVSGPLSEEEMVIAPDRSLIKTAGPAVPSIARTRPATQITPPRPKYGPNPDATATQVLRERYRQLCLSLFLREQAPVRSLGFTSSVPGEGKTFLAKIMAGILADDSSEPVALLECNWEHPEAAEYCGVPATPGLAEWLRRECGAEEIRHHVHDNLTIIPAGNSRHDSVKLLQQIRQKGLGNIFASSGELLIVDLPPIVTAGHGVLAASLVDALIIVVRAGVTADLLIEETCAQLENLPVQGVILNQVASRIPRWIRQLL